MRKVIIGGRLNMLKWLRIVVRHLRCMRTPGLKDYCTSNAVHLQGIREGSTGLPHMLIEVSRGSIQSFQENSTVAACFEAYHCRALDVLTYGPLTSIFLFYCLDQSCTIFLKPVTMRH
jgi:hypothetical protein